MKPRSLHAALVLAVSLLGTAAPAQPLPVKTVAFDSEAVGRKMKYNLILPEKYERGSERYPVLYLLHGYSGNYSNWAHLGVPEYARRYDLIIVMPDVGNSWYVNWAQSDEGQKNRWEDFMVKDLIGHIDATYRTIARREGRAINGLSMGGYGSLVLGLRHPDLFCSVGSHSGAVAFAKSIAQELRTGKKPERPRREPSKQPDARIGVPGFSSQAERSPHGRVFTKPEEAEAHDPFQLVLRVPRDQLPHLYIDCGTEDRLLGSNRDFVKLLMEHKIPFVYGESRGGHTGVYWRREVAVSLAVQDALLQRNLAASGQAKRAAAAAGGARPTARP